MNEPTDILNEPPEEKRPLTPQEISALIEEGIRKGRVEHGHHEKMLPKEGEQS